MNRSGQTNAKLLIAVGAFLAICGLGVFIWQSSGRSPTPLTGPDPLAEMIREQRFQPFLAPTEKADIGDAYRKYERGRYPVPDDGHVTMRSLPFKERELQQWMEDRSSGVFLWSKIRELTFTLDHSLELLGSVKAELSAARATRYAIVVGDVRLYELNRYAWRQFFPRVRKLKPDRGKWNGLYIIHSLLQVGSLSYKFMDQNGGKVSFDSSAAQSMAAKLGPEWKVTEEGELKVDRPAFIGFRVAQLKDWEDAPPGVDPQGMDFDLLDAPIERK